MKTLLLFLLVPATVFAAQGTPVSGVEFIAQSVSPVAAGAAGLWRTSGNRLRCRRTDTTDGNLTMATASASAAGPSSASPLRLYSASLIPQAAAPTGCAGKVCLWLNLSGVAQLHATDNSNTSICIDSLSGGGVPSRYSPKYAAFIFTPQSVSPIRSGQDGLWLDAADGVLKEQSSAGSQYRVGCVPGCQVATCAYTVTGCAAPTDSDADGLNDAWETQGGVDIDCDGSIGAADFSFPVGETPTVGTKDLYLRIRAMAAAAGTYDLGFACTVDEDCVLGGDGFHNWCETGTGLCSDEPPEGHATSTAAITLLQAAFTAKGIVLHVDSETTGTIPHYSSLQFFTDDGCGAFGASYATQIKVAPYWDTKMEGVYHFAVFAHAWCAQPSVTGVSEIYSDDSLVTLGTSSFSFDATTRATMEAGTLMHEFGHQLNLTHVPIDRQPNVLSVMNYRYQFNGIYPADVPETDPPTILTTTARVDYSSFAMTTLDEAHLNETAILQSGSNDTVTFNCPNAAPRRGRAGSKIDWNCDNDGAIDTDVQVNINAQSGAAQVMPGKEEWSLVSYRFQCAPSTVGPQP